MHLLHVLGKLLCNLKWKALLKLGKWIAVVFFGMLTVSTITNRRYCDDVTEPSRATHDTATRFRAAIGSINVTSDGVPSSMTEVKIPSAKESEASPSNVTNNKPIKVLLLTYYRGGSTFLGELLNQVQDAFYLYEPSAPVYAYMYGAGGDVMSYFYPNESFRYPVQFESDLYATALSNMLNCRLKNLPTEFFTHKFRYQSPHLSMKSYRTCMSEHSSPSTGICSNYLPQTCHQAYEPSQWCHEQISRVIDCVQIRDCSRYNVAGFFEHRQCLEDTHRKHVLPCVPSMQQVCDAAPVRVAKAIRLSMDAVTSLVSADPSIKVVHMVRDPRGILPSRKTISQNMFAHLGLDRSASELCVSMLRDVKMRESLEESHKGTFMQIKYEDLAGQPVETMRKLFDFLGLPVSLETHNWVVGATHASQDTKGIFGVFRQNSTRTASNWQNTLNDEEKGIIGNTCRELLLHLKYDL